MSSSELSVEKVICILELIQWRSSRMSRTSEDSLSELAGKVEAKEGSNFNLSLSMVVLREE